MELLTIEKELAGAEGEAALERYDEQLVALGARLRRALDGGLAPAEFATCEPLAEAVTIARKLLRLQVRKG